MTQQLNLPLDLERPRVKPGIRDTHEGRIAPHDLMMVRIYLRDNLRRLRNARKLSKTGLSVWHNISPDTIARIESGNLPCMISAFKLMEAFGLTVDRIRYELTTLQMVKN